MNQGVPLSKMSCESGKCACPACGATASQPEKGFVLHWCKARKRGLGDMVAAGLSAVGITEERVSKLVGGDCGCSKRKQLLNQLGRKIGIGQEG
jgi:hypothetical protein